MFPLMFWVKYLFRVMHIGSLVVLCQGIISNKLNGAPSNAHGWLYMTSGILVIVSGKP